MMEKYNLLEEIEYKNRYYYLSDKGDILLLKLKVKFPNSPVNCMKTYCQKELFTVIDENQIHYDDLENKLFALMIKYGL